MPNSGPVYDVSRYCFDNQFVNYEVVIQAKQKPYQIDTVFIKMKYC